jgi:hypothetical protein
MLSDIITDVVARQPDMEVVGRLEDRVVLPSAADELQADVVILGLPDADLPDGCVRLLDPHPHVRVAGDGRFSGSVARSGSARRRRIGALSSHTSLTSLGVTLTGEDATMLAEAFRFRPDGPRACLFREPLEDGLVAALQRAME